MLLANKCSRKRHIIQLVDSSLWAKKLQYVYVTGYGKTDHFAHYFKIELLVFKGSVDLKQ